MDGFAGVALFLLFAGTVVERLVEYLVSPVKDCLIAEAGKRKGVLVTAAMNWSAATVGVFVAYLFDLGAFTWAASVAGIKSTQRLAWGDNALTGILIAGGANYLHGLFTWVLSGAKEKKARIEALK